jgi:hypothetical protein
LNVVPKIGSIADGDGIAFAALDVLGDVLPADAGGDRALHIAHGQSIARRFLPVHFNVDVSFSAATPR